MLVKRIIPCLDVNAGRVVKGVKFLELRDAGDPVEIARAYDKEGADELCFLDITASHQNRGIILDVVSRTAEQVFMPLTVGGGINSLKIFAACCGLAPIRFPSIPGRSIVRNSSVRRPKYSAANASSLLLTLNGLPIAGRYSLTAEGIPPISMQRSGRSEWKNLALEKYCSPAWIATALKPVMILA